MCWGKERWRKKCKFAVQVVARLQLYLQGDVCQGCSFELQDQWAGMWGRLIHVFGTQYLQYISTEQIFRVRYIPSGTYPST